MQRFVLVCLFIVGCFFILTPFTHAEDKLTILFSGETHSHLDPCDCPLSPDGGVARRATVIKQVRNNNPAVLVLDAGGAYASGKYDEETLGKEADRYRNDVNLRAMELMGYDFLAIGDEELAFGPDYLMTKMKGSSIQYLSANLYQADGTRIAEPFKIKTIGKLRVGIIGLTTPELTSGEFRLVAKNLKVTDPIKEVAKLLPAVKKQADIIIVLSHLGEELSKKLLDQVAGIDLLINGHRKVSARPFDQVNNTVFAQFSFQGKTLGKIEFSLDANQKIIDTKVEEIRLGKEISDEEEVADLLKTYKESITKTKRKVIVDLYLMSDCPYGQEAEQTLFPLIKEFTSWIDFNLYYLIEKSDDGFVSLHGEEELQEGRRQLAVAKLYPDKLFDYILCYNESIKGSSNYNCLRQLEFDLKMVDDLAASEEISDQLSEHYERSKRLRVVSSPTLYINNAVYQDRLDAVLLKKILCEKLSETAEEKPQICKEIPECFTDADCFRAGQEGICLGAGTKKARCEYQKAVTFENLVVVAGDCLTCNQLDIISSTQVLFPGVEIRMVDKRTAEGEKLIKKYDIKFLPAYIFDPEVEDTRKFKEVKSGFYRKEDKLLLSPELVGASYLLDRVEQPQKIEIFMAALSGRARVVVNEIIDYLAENPSSAEINYHIIGFLNEKGEAVSPLGLSEDEEARRTLVVKKFHPDKFLDYLKLRNVQSSYWEETLISLGLNPQQIKKLAEGQVGRQLFRKEAELLNDLPLGEELGFLINNREIARINSLESFRSILETLTASSQPEKKH